MVFCFVLCFAYVYLSRPHVCSWFWCYTAARSAFGWFPTLLSGEPIFSSSLHTVLLLQGTQARCTTVTKPGLTVVGPAQHCCRTQLRHNTVAKPNHSPRVDTRLLSIPLVFWSGHNCPTMQIWIGTEGPTRKDAQSSLPCCWPSVKSAVLLGMVQLFYSAPFPCQCNI